MLDYVLKNGLFTELSWQSWEKEKEKKNGKQHFSPLPTMFLTFQLKIASLPENWYNSCWDHSCINARYKILIIIFTHKLRVRIEKYQLKF